MAFSEYGNRFTFKNIKHLKKEIYATKVCNKTEQFQQDKRRLIKRVLTTTKAKWDINNFFLLRFYRRKEKFQWLDGKFKLWNKLGYKKGNNQKGKVSCPFLSKHIFWKGATSLYIYLLKLSLKMHILLHNFFP